MTCAAPTSASSASSTGRGRTIVIELIGRRNDDAVYKQLERKQG
jgi:hypothetical protein